MLMNFQEKKFYQERCAECLRALLAWKYSIELTDHDAADRAAENNTSLSTSSRHFFIRQVNKVLSISDLQAVAL